MSAQPLEAPSLVLVTTPPEMVESENLVIRQANALVIASDDDYEQAGKFLYEVIVPGKEQVHELFDDHCSRAFENHRALTGARAKHLNPWETAERFVKAERVRYFREKEEREETERRERERKARAIEDERKRQEAAAERERAEEEAKRRRDEAETKRLAAEVEAERLRNIEANDREKRAADLRAKQIEEEAARESQRAEAEAVAIAKAGEEAAKAIEQEKTIVDLPAEAGSRLTGVSKPWGVNKEKWDRIAFALWIAGNPAEGSPAYIAATERAEYIGEPAWSLLTAKAKQQKHLFNVGGIEAGIKYSGRAGRS